MRVVLIIAACLPLVGGAAEKARPANADLEPAVATSSAATAPAAPAVAAATKPAAGAPATVRAPKPAQGSGAGSAATATGPKSAVRDRLELQATQITGNRELPRVMYVVPWKHPDPGDLSGRPANSLLDEVLAPVDRDVFQRQNRYYNALKPDGGP
jgi:hypothetical protein